jgi:hypothetical protein
LLRHLEEHVSAGQEADLYLTNFVYEHVSDGTSYERDYSANFPACRIFDWSGIRKPFRYTKTLLMHALLYRTEILRECGLRLPEHTFYVDNIFAYVPLPFVKKLSYLPIPLYRYFIGRADQSVALANISARYAQQIAVMKIMLAACPSDRLKRLPKGLKKYMRHNLDALMMLTQMFVVSKADRQRKADLKEMWSWLKETDLGLYRFLKYGSYYTLVHFLPFRLKSILMVGGYKILARKIKFG